MPDNRPKFEKGNQLWLLASHKVLARRRWKHPAELLEELVEYFLWMEANPLEESKLVSFQGVSALEGVPKMRAVSLQSMRGYLGIGKTKWEHMRKGNDLVGFAEVVEWAEEMMHSINFEGANAGLLNPMLIARQLGLADRTELTGRDGAPMETQTTDMTQLDLDTLKKLKAAQIAKGQDEPSAE
jgi:hypothetical protein